MQKPDNRDESLTAALRALDEHDRTTGASPQVEARLLAEVRRVAWVLQRRRYVTVVAIAAALFLAVALPAWRITRQRPLPNPVATHAPVSRGEVATAFLPLIYSNVPVTNAQIVRMKVSRSALVSFGLASIDSLDPSSAATVLADVIVGEDGLARAVRFVRPIAHQE